MYVTYADPLAAVAAAREQEQESFVDRLGKVYGEGFAAGVKAAREAIVGLGHSPMYLTDVLAAIDALRGGS